MKIANVRDVRNRFSALETFLRDGEKIEIRKRGKPIAWLVPVPGQEASGLVKPNFLARRKTIWGQRVFTPAQVLAMRDEERQGEEG